MTEGETIPISKVKASIRRLERLRKKAKELGDVRIYNQSDEIDVAIANLKALLPATE